MQEGIYILCYDLKVKWLKIMSGQVGTEIF